MALIKTKPTSPGRRFVVKPDRSHLHKGAPVASLTASQKRTGARNNQGRITTRHKGGGHRHRYRIVDFLRFTRQFNAAFPGFDTDVHGLVEEEQADGTRRYFVDCVRSSS